MNSKKIFFALVAILALLGIGILLSAYGANAFLSHYSKRLVDLKTESASLSQQQVQLAQDKKDLATYKDLNKIAQTVVPQDKDQAEAVREIVKLASDSGISRLSSISFPSSNLGGSGASPSTGQSGGLTQVTPVKGIPGIFDLQITVQQDTTSMVPYGKFITFLTKLEQNRRTAQVNSISVLPDPKNTGQVSFTLVIDEFIKP
ncbi:MAG: hypothetical protein WC498_00050 [Candidatus Saccharimonadales bacterium]